MKAIKGILVPALLLLASCCDEHTQEQQPEAAPPPVTPAGMQVENIDADKQWTRVAYVLTDTKTGRKYLLNAAGGAPVEIGP